MTPDEIIQRLKRHNVNRDVVAAVEELIADVERLQLLLDAAKRLLRARGRVMYGHSSEHDRKGYFLFGPDYGGPDEWAGTSWDDVIAAEAAREKPNG